MKLKICLNDMTDHICRINELHVQVVNKFKEEKHDRVPLTAAAV